MTIRNLFPHDNRSVEIASAASLLLLVAHMLVMPHLFLDLVKVQPLEFWLITCTTLGGLQFLSLLAYPNSEVLRTVMSWVNGLVWIWLSLSISGQLAVGIILGFSNLYAFVINANLLRETWKH